MATATRDAAAQRQLIEQHKATLERDVDRTVGDVKELTDIKSRLRKEGPRIAAIGGAIVVLVGTSLVLRAVLRRRLKRAEHVAVEVAGEEATLAALVAELALLRAEMGKQRKGGGGSGGLAGKVAVAAVSAAASAAGKQAANRLVDQAKSKTAD